ncbi:hypothetical protein [Cellulomonas hominis]|uniref:hypothetical protein n=1 Tax=Cellulomonas hominis TaxID=156981 RepID=UPI001BCD1DED|nr:hypothetical protein [Cellulomonas hominis]
MSNLLTLVPGAAPEHGAYFWEPLVDGVPVRRLLGLQPDEVALDTRGFGPVGDNVPVLVHSWPRPSVDGALVLLGETVDPELPDDRAALYVCAACADLGCGAIGMRVERTPTTVVWRDFRWETGGAWDGDEALIVPGGPFVFDRVQHDAELQRFVSTYEAERAALPDDAAVHVGQRRDAAERARPWWRRVWG